MPTMQISSEGEPLEHAEYEGSWWVSTTPDEIGAGRLSIDSNSYGTLFLPLGLLPPDDLHNTSVIYGLCGTKKFTLLGALRKVYSHDDFDSEQKTKEEYWQSGLILEGAHVESLDAICIKSFTFETEHLIDWLNMPFVTDNLDARNPVLSTQVPENIEFTVDEEGSFSIGWRTWHGRTGHEATIRITPEITFTPVSTIGLVKFLTSVMQPFLNFLSFGLDYSDTSKNLRVNYDGDAGPMPLRTNIGGLLTNSKQRRIFPSEQVLPFKVIEAELETFVRNWFSLSKCQEYSMEEFFSIFHDAEVINERDFPRLVGALESWHSHWKPILTQVEANIFETEKAILGQHVSIEMAELLRVKLDNRPFLRTRINELIDESSEHIKQAVNIVPNFVTLCINTRNGMVHVDPGNKVFTRRQKLYAHQILVSLLSSLMLKHLGVADSDIDKRLDKDKTRCIPIWAANYIHGELTADDF